VHVYEHFRSLITAWRASENPNLGRAVEIYAGRIEKMLTPAGGPMGDEAILRRDVDPTDTGYEYCSIHELLHSYCFLIQKTGDSRHANHIERILFNAAPGAKIPAKQCIAYLKTDNSYVMTGEIKRYKYSPTHVDMAVCCPPNAGRIYPYYVSSMWMKDAEGFAGLLPGPCVVNTRWHETPVRIESITDYPYGDDFRVTFTSEEDVNLKIKIRLPEWAERVSAEQPFEQKEGFIVFTIDGKQAELRYALAPEVRVHSFAPSHHYFTCGALVYAHPIEGESETVRSYPLAGYHDYYYRPKDLTTYEYAEDHGAVRTGPHEIQLRLINKDTGERERVKLVPVGETVLRQVTF
jgi:hypothetical protein